VGVITELLYAEPLLVHDWTGRPVSRLVDRWEWHPRGTALTIRLKDNIRWHDGSPLTADAVVRFLRQSADQKRFGFRHVTGIAAVGQNAVTIQLSQPDFFLLPELSEIKVTHPDRTDVGTGPFRVSSRSPLEVQRFDSYHAGRSSLAGVRISTYDTQRSAWAALMRGEIDVVQEVGRDSVEFMEGSSNIDTYPSVQPFYIPLLLNVSHPALKNVEVRRAISEALDRSAIIERAMRGRGRIADGPIWPYHWAHPTRPSSYSFDPAHAASRLDKAGFPLPLGGQQGELRKRFAFKCLVYSEDPQFERIALLIQRQLFDVGIAMEIELADLNTLFGIRAPAGEYDALLIRMQAGRGMDYTYRMWRSGAAEARVLNSGYTGVDTLLDELRVSLSDDDTRRIVAQLAERFHLDAPAVFIAWTEVTRAVSSRFDVGENRGQDPFFNMWQWRPRDVTADR
jgi:peptide/nickel transport system substrate-binding protein